MTWDRMELHDNALSSTATSVAAKAAERAKLWEAMEQFEREHGITRIPSSLGREAKLYRMASGEMPLISFHELAKRWGVNSNNLNILMNHHAAHTLFVTKRAVRHWAVEDIERLEKIEGYPKSKLTKKGAH